MCAPPQPPAAGLCWTRRTRRRGIRRRCGQQQHERRWASCRTPRFISGSVPRPSHRLPQVQWTQRRPPHRTGQLHQRSSAVSVAGEIACRATYNTSGFLMPPTARGTHRLGFHVDHHRRRLCNAKRTFTGRQRGPPKRIQCAIRQRCRGQRLATPSIPIARFPHRFPHHGIRGRLTATHAAPFHTLRRTLHRLRCPSAPPSGHRLR